MGGIENIVDNALKPLYVLVYDKVKNARWNLKVFLNSQINSSLPCSGRSIINKMTRMNTVVVSCLTTF